VLEQRQPGLLRGLLEQALLELRREPEDALQQPVLQPVS
jgi:hypothetical protein